MAGPKKSKAFGAQMERWEILLDELQKHLQEWQYMQDEYDALLALLDECRQLNNQQEHLKGELKVITAQLRAKRREGERIYSKLVRFIKGELGPKSPELTKFIPAAETEVDKTKYGWGEKEK